MKHKTRTKALSWLLSLAMALSLLPGMSLTARADGHDHSSWTGWSTTGSLPTEAGSYYLTQDVTIGSTWTVPTGTTNLCLNGHGIRYNGSGNASVITVGSGATLNLYDCGTTEHYITLTNGRGTAVSDTGTESATCVKVTGGYITGGNCSDNDYSNSDSGVKVVEGGTFTMYGGTIIGNKAKNRGGGVNNYGTFTMNGGLVTNNSVINNGGGVNNDGTFTMNGGSIENNTAGSGGGVNITSGTFTMSGGSITGNRTNTNNGGGVNNFGGTFTMSGGSITGNTANNGGGGVYNWNTFNMTGGTISGSPALYNDHGTLNINGGDSKAVLVTTNTEGTGDKLTYDAANVNTYGYIAVVPTYRAATVNEETHEVTFSEQTVNDYTVVASDTKNWTDDKWYVVSSDVTVSTRITVTGTANLILCDGATLTANKGITVAEGNTLNIYGQSGGTGELIANGEQYQAGVGGINGNGGTVTVHGGKVTANGGEFSAGIGSGDEGGAGGVTTIYGGTVRANGGKFGAGIGGGRNGSGGTVVINGGEVTARGGSGTEGGAGIGGGKGGSGGTVTIHGGTVTAIGTGWGAGIGGGWNGSGGTVEINGGTVTATGGTGGAGIGGGMNGNGGEVTINGGTVTANGGTGDAVGIGAGYNNSQHSTLTLGTGMALYGNATTAEPETDVANYVRPTESGYARTRYMTVNNDVPHTHDFTYSVSDDLTTITATCGEEGCTLDDGAGNHTATLTIAAPANLIVGVGAKEATLEGEIPGVTPTITYTPGGAAPTTPGTYTASVTLGGATASVQYTLKAASYTITIPARLPVSKSGWNATAGITAKGEIAEGKMLRIRAESGNDWKLTQDGQSETITYNLATAANGAKTTAWNFSVADLAGDGTTKPMGAVVEEYINKPEGNYTDTVTFTAELVDTTSVTLADALVNGATFSVTFTEDEDVYVASFANVNGELVNPALTRNGEAVTLKANDDHSNGYYLSSWTYNGGFVVHLSSIDSGNVLNAFQTYLSFDTEKNVRHDKNVTSIVVNGVEIIDSVPYEKQSGGD